MPNLVCDRGRGHGTFQRIGRAQARALDIASASHPALPHVHISLPRSFRARLRTCNCVRSGALPRS
eukprot:8109728-Alexandrium_andersonii.AAC.1